MLRDISKGSDVYVSQGYTIVQLQLAKSSRAYPRDNLEYLESLTFIPRIASLYGPHLPKVSTVSTPYRVDAMLI